jgi:Staphylococcal nuclease homologue
MTNTSGRAGEDLITANKWVRPGKSNPIAVSGKGRGIHDYASVLSMDGGCSMCWRVHGERAVHLLQTSNTSVDQIAAEVGYANGVTLRTHTLVKDGWCWWYRKYAPGDTVLEGLEKDAREAKKGLWVNPAPIPPWVYRKARRGQSFDLSDLVPLDAETEGGASSRGPLLLGAIEKDSASSASASTSP